MPTEPNTVSCGSCGVLLAKSPDIAAAQSQPCPRCGSMSREFHIHFNGTIQMHGLLKMKGKRRGLKRPYIEQVVGMAFQYSLGIWAKLRRVIDRENDRYRKTVVDPKTGEVLYHCDEPLSEHIGHGDAKHARKRTSPGRH